MSRPEEVLGRLRGFFRERGWTPHAFQEETWAAYLAGESGLVHVPTGAGKTYAAYLGPLAEVVAHGKTGVQLVYLSPLRAVSRDVERALQEPVEHLGARLRVESRTSDTRSSLRARQKDRLPEVLVTTPESLSLLLTDPRAPERFRGLRGVVIDEWHELLGTKRGTQVELALSRLRGFAPGLRTWAMSATLANLEEAAQAAVGLHARARLVRAELTRPLEVETLPPENVDGFPWAGHLGLAMLERVADWLNPAEATLLFTNTRAQAEKWHAGLEYLRPQWDGLLALHHGSLDRQVREDVELGLKLGRTRIVVATSSLDLGVDFGPVERVVQVGSPKALGRVLQRAGRGAHRPGATQRLLFVPTNALELVEMAAAREALARGEVEARRPLHQPLDVLAQHLVTCALGGGFTRDGMLEALHGTLAYRALTREELGWTLELVHTGGPALTAYEAFRRAEELPDGTWAVLDARVARLHRMNVGTIASDASVQLKYWNGLALGHVDEGYVGRLQRGDTFLFGGKPLTFVRMKDMVAYVRPARGKTTRTPRFTGSRLPLSPSLSASVRRAFAQAREGRLVSPELEAARPMLEAQARLSRLPGEDALLAEVCETRDGHHLFLYPFEGRLVHEGLAALLALRLTRRQKATFSLSVNDYGLELVCPTFFPYEEALTAGLFTREGLEADVEEAVNVTELARRTFRDVARVAGLVLPGLPSARKSTRQLQASAGLLYDVLVKYDPENLLVRQARREVLEAQFELPRMEACLERLACSRLELVHVPRPSPLAFPLVVERISATVSSESLLERVERLKKRWSREDSPAA